MNIFERFRKEIVLTSVLLLLGGIIFNKPIFAESRIVEIKYNANDLIQKMYYMALFNSLDSIDVLKCIYVT